MAGADINYGMTDSEENQTKLDLFLLKPKPQDTLKINDIFVLNRDVNIPGHGLIEKGNKVQIIEIIEPVEELRTTEVFYKIIGGEDELLDMSKGIFIDYFCEEIKANQDEYNKRLIELKTKNEKSLSKLNSLVGTVKGKLDSFLGDSSKIKNLEEVQKELDLFLLKPKPQDALKINDIFILKRDVDIPGNGVIEKGNKVQIIEIIEPVEELITTGISYKIIGGKDELLDMSRGIFVEKFCDEIREEQDEYDKKLSELKSKKELIEKSLKK